jgi:hypothetical protein
MTSLHSGLIVRKENVSLRQIAHAGCEMRRISGVLEAGNWLAAPENVAPNDGQTGRNTAYFLYIRDLPDRLEYRVTQNHTRTHLILRTLAWATGVSLTFLFAGESRLLAICLFGIFLYAAVTDIQYP